MTNNITKLKKLFAEHKIDGYLISTRDEYLSEYPPKNSRRLEYLTGFTGSNAITIVLKNKVLFFTDGRYLTQCKSELDSEVLVFDQKNLVRFSWKDYINDEDIIGFDPRILNNNILHYFNSINLKSLENNLIDEIWYNKPKAPSSKIYDYNISFAGQSAEDKIAKCREFLSHYKAQYLIITNPESVCWLFNIRASDLEFSPLLLAHACISQDKSYLFVESSVNHNLKEKKPFIDILPNEYLSQIINNAEGKILFDDNFCPKYYSDLIKQRQFSSITNPCLLWKSCKNSVEIERMIEGHIEDGIAMCEFLAFLSYTDLKNYSEYDIGLVLTDFRSKRKNYISDSFPSIVGFGSNSAVIHYRADQHSAKKISSNGLLLIDSGGQYLGATTDITRVISIGAPSMKHKEYYTKILKGHLSLAMIKFPKNAVTGANLDILARQFLWDRGEDYPHGTGHGVGSFLSVHEGPQNISLNSYNTYLANGMVVSNEPGFYAPDEFGIRIENMMYVKDSLYNNFLEFEMLTLVPYEMNLIDFDLLTVQEKDYLDNYYAKLERLVLPHLSQKAKNWFASACIKK